MPSATTHLTQLANWAMTKTTCSDCFSVPPADPAYEACRIVRALLHKSLRDYSNPVSALYRRHVYPRLQDVHHGNPRRRNGDWHHRTMERWLAAEDRSYLGQPEFVDLEMLYRGGVPPELMPDFGMINTHHTSLQRRLLQFLIDYFGVCAVLQMNTAGVLLPLMHALEACPIQRNETFTQISFHRRVHTELVHACLAHTPRVIAYRPYLPTSLPVAAEVIVEAYFNVLPQAQRKEVLETIFHDLGIADTTSRPLG